MNLVRGDVITELIERERVRQARTLMMIPSENYASIEVRRALGTELSNKYAEGYPGKRYYQGNKIVDEIENIAIERAKKLFGVVHVNVQPYSGSPANAAAIMAMVEPGETIMGLKLSGGGHLTHGHPGVTFSGKFFRSVQFDVTADGWIDYDEVERLAWEHKPKLLIVGTTAYPRILDFERFGKISKACGAYLLADISHIAGLVVAGVHPSPVEYVDVVMTTTHKTLRGPRGAMLMVTQLGLDRDGDLAKKIDKAVFPGLQGGPHNNQTAAIAVALGEAGTPEFVMYGRRVVENAKALAYGLMKSGIELSTSGTDNHLMVIDLRKMGLSGKEMALKLEMAGIVTNYNTVPHDTNPPAKPSGIRLGTPALTTRGMGKEEMISVADWIAQVLKNSEDVKVLVDIKKQVERLCERFPINR